MRIVLVSHFHWDREWYRPFEAYRARLVDAIDHLLDLLDADPGYRFLLDGQGVVLEDYLAIRPHRRDALAAALAAGRLSTGPWYVQPDMLLPSGEALVRNLLRGRRVVEALGPVSTVAYVPDSFGHPAQAPQLFAGFGLAHFVYWRGNGNELDRLGGRYRWLAPDGSAVVAVLLADGYFNAACLPADAEDAAAQLAQRLPKSPAGTVLLMNGIDHMVPDSHTGAVAAALARASGATVERGLLEDAVVSQHDAQLPEMRGELVGGRLANLLPGVWSTYMPIKLANRRCETLLGGWLEPWTALGRRLGGGDERPSLALAWRDVLHNQAHDSICGCSIDRVTDAVVGRYVGAEALGEQTLQRVLERLAGRGVERRTPDSTDQDVVVFNPSPHPRTDVVRLALDPYPAMALPLGVPAFHPLAIAAMEDPGFAIDGVPARVTASADPERTRWVPPQQALDVEFVARDVPAFGCRRFTLTRCDRAADALDDGGEIESGPVRVSAADDGTLTVRLGDRRFARLFGVEDLGDRGDSYDFDPVDDDPGARLRSVIRERRRHPSGLAALRVTRVFDLPSGLTPDRERRADAIVPLTVTIEARVAPGVPRVDVEVTVDNTARDHRLRLLLPTGAPLAAFSAATTFDVAARSTAPADDRGWVHPAPTTFAHQGWIAGNGLTVVAAGLPEAEVGRDGTIAVTLLRAVGWLSRFDLRRRPILAGPVMATDGTQVLGRVTAQLSLLADGDANAARDAELRLRGVLGGPTPLLPERTPLLTLAPAALVLSAVKPTERGDGIVVRVANPTDQPQRAVIELGFAVARALAIRLDETPANFAVSLAGSRLEFDVPPHALRSVLL